MEETEHTNSRGPARIVTMVGFQARYWFLEKYLIVGAIDELVPSQCRGCGKSSPVFVQEYFRTQWNQSTKPIKNREIILKINTIKTMINKNLTSVTNVTGKISGRGHVKTGFLFKKKNNNNPVCITFTFQSFFYPHLHLPYLCVFKVSSGSVV